MICLSCRKQLHEKKPAGGWIGKNPAPDRLFLYLDKQRNGMKLDPTQEQIRAMFDYEDGNLYCKYDFSKKFKKGMSITRVNVRPLYFYINFQVGNEYFKDSVRHRLNRLIYIYHHGKIPYGKRIINIDGDPSNNRIENLKCVNPGPRGHEKIKYEYHKLASFDDETLEQIKNAFNS